MMSTLLIPVDATTARQSEYRLQTGQIKQTGSIALGPDVSLCAFPGSLVRLVISATDVVQSPFDAAIWFTQAEV